MGPGTFGSFKGPLQIGDPSVGLPVLASLISVSSNGVFCTWWRSGYYEEALVSYLSNVTWGIMCKVVPSGPDL